MSDATRAASVGPTDMIAVVQQAGIALATVAQRRAETDARLAALEARQGNVPLSGALPVATLQVGTTDVPVAVPGLLSTDRVSVMIRGASLTASASAPCVRTRRTQACCSCRPRPPCSWPASRPCRAPSPLTTVSRLR